MAKKLSEDAEKLELHLKYLFEHQVNLKQRIITIDKDIDSSVFSFIDAALSELEAYSRQAITIRVFSEGVCSARIRVTQLLLFS